MQVARTALQQEHQFEVEALEKDWITKLETLRADSNDKENRLSYELKRAI